MKGESVTPQEYIDQNKVKPLTEKEIQKGKEHLTIFGTDDPIPWEEVYTRIAAGMDMGHIAHIYGNGRKIALWAVHDGITKDQTISDLLDSEIEQRNKMQEIANVNPTVAQTLHDMANEYAPDSAKNIAIFANKVVIEATNALSNPRKTSLDLVNLTKAVQTASDTLGHTQRHASGNTINNNTIKVDGFGFVEDLGPQQLIEGQVINE